jgi:hypothetical protein
MRTVWRSAISSALSASISSGRASMPVFIEAHFTAENRQFVEEFGAKTPGKLGVFSPPVRA